MDVRVKITPLFERFYRFQTEEVAGNLNRNMERSTLSGLGTAVVKGAMFSGDFYAMPQGTVALVLASARSLQVYMIRFNAELS